MGQYLSAPVTEKESEEGQNDRLAYGLSAMQGWRVSMEDAHISKLDLDNQHTALFAVFDGHGGKAVAKYAAIHMPDCLVKTDAYKRKDFGTAIAQSYYKLDEMLDTEEGQAELRVLAGVAAAASRAPTQGGLFAHIEDNLDTPEQKSEPEPPAEPVEDASTAAATGELVQKPSNKLKKVDSSEEFMKSALMRHSIVPAGAATPEPAIASLESIIRPETTHEGDDEGDDQSEGSDIDSHTATGMGCTAVSVLIHHGMVTVANTGDSRCVISRKGEATPLTLDHKPIIYEEAQRIIRAGGFVRDNRVNGALNVSRTIGDLDFKRNSELPHTEQMVVATPDITDFELQDGDEFLILACDGIWDVLSNQEAVDFVRKKIRQGQSLKSICEAMCDFCLAPDLKGMCRGADNMSVIIVLFKKHADLESFWYKLWSSITCLFGGK